MNKNQKLILEALNNNVTLNTLKFSSDFKGFELENQEINDLEFANGEFLNAKLSNVSFDNCILSDCFFNNCELNGVTFNNCSILKTDISNTKFSNTIFQSTTVKKTIFEEIIVSNITVSGCFFEDVDIYNLNAKGISVNNCEFFNLESFFVKVSDIQFVENIIKQSEIGKSDLTNVEFSKNRLEKTAFKKTRFKALKWSDNKLLNIIMVNCEGLKDTILSDVLNSGGRIEPISRILLKNKIFMLFFTIFLSCFIYISFMISLNSKYIYVRYVIREIWSDPYRTDFGRELKALYRFTINKDNIRKIVNNAIFAKYEGDLTKAMKLFQKSIVLINKDNVYYDLNCWFISEINRTCKDESEWKVAWNLVESNVSYLIIQDIRLFMAGLFERRYFPDVTLKIMSKILLNTENDVSTVIKLNEVLDNINITYIDFKSKAYMMMRSFSKRRIDQNINNKEQYMFIKDNAESWIEYYSMLANKN